MPRSRRQSLCSLIDRDRRERASALLEPLFAIRSLEVTGQRISIAIGREEAALAYVPLSILALELGRRSGRAMLAVTGPPGSGKSVLAKLLTRAVEALDADRDVHPVWMGLDGFHYPNETLRGRTVSAAGEGQVPMKLYKGAEFTYDVEAAKAKFIEIRNAHGWSATAPAYDRSLHEPAPGRVLVPKRCRLVVVEGNYLLLDNGDWRGMADVFDLSIYLDAAAEHCRPGLIARHRLGGRGQADAEQHYERVDLRNARVIEATRSRADLVVEKGAGHRVRGVWVQHPRRVRELL